MVEDTEVVSRSGTEEREVRLLAQVDKGENVRNPGSDVKSGEKVLEKGDVISPVGGELGTLAFVGRRSVSTFFFASFANGGSIIYSTIGVCSSPPYRSSTLDWKRSCRRP